MTDLTGFPPETFRTGRTSPLLNSQDSSEKFIEFMFHQLDPGEWHISTENGFTWFPFTVPHSIYSQQIAYSDGTKSDYIFSDFILGSCSAFSHALAFVQWVNQSNVGAICWVDEETTHIHLTSYTSLNPARWWQSDIFANNTMRLVSIAHRLSDGLVKYFETSTAPDASHPVLGLREEPDQLLAEIGFDNSEPEYISGFWFSEIELDRYFNSLRYLVSKLKDSEFHSDAKDERIPTNDRLHSKYSLEVEHPVVGDFYCEVTNQISDHPELGMGFERLIELQLFAEETPVLAPNISLEASRITNALNQVQCLLPVVDTVPGPWTTWGDQIFHSTFISGQTLRMLMFDAKGRIGDVLATIGGPDDCISTLNSALNHLQLWRFSNARELSATDGWMGITQNANKWAILTDSAIATRQLIEETPINQLLSEAIEVDADHPLWLFRHDEVLVTWGIFNPTGPSLGSLEILINYELMRAILVERVIHPFGSKMKIHAILDREGFNRQDDFAFQVMNNLDWPIIEWCEIRDTSFSDHMETMRGSLYGYAKRVQPEIDEIKSAVRIAIASIDSPWIRLNNPDIESDFEFSEDPWRDWVDVVTHSFVINSNLKYLRGAWQGSLGFQTNADLAQYAATACDYELCIRDGIIPLQTSLEEYFIDRFGPERAEALQHAAWATQKN